MKIKRITSQIQRFELSKPYTIAYQTTSSVENIILELELENGVLAYGAGAPCQAVTQETIKHSQAALQTKNLQWCLGQPIENFWKLRVECQQKLGKTPGACAALDIALHDAYGQYCQKPVFELYGRVHHSLPTSITIGIKNIEKTYAEALEYISKGFKVLKIKLGLNLQEDIKTLWYLRRHLPNGITLRVDPNQGYNLNQLKIFFESTEDIDLELIEQPLNAKALEQYRQLPKKLIRKIALDESLIFPQDALSSLYPTPCAGIFNIKLMKCGGILAAHQIATIAQVANLDLMWGCNDESKISITAALHIAFCCPATKYIDLDGSFDIKDDVVTGGFKVKDGMMFPLELPGLGIKHM